MEEQFKIIEGFEKYSVSNFGRIRREVPGPNAIVGVIKNAQVNPVTGYCHVKVSGSEGKRSMSIHRLVAEAFLENPEGKKEIDHIDKNKQNNRLDNLRWVTRRENMSGIKHGIRSIIATSPDGEETAWDCIRDCAAWLGVFPQGISNVLNNPRYTHYKKWKFRYKDGN
jgi:hypothetical protein